VAQACLAAALAIAAPAVPMAVIGMGKLGGEELNYASDVDVVFVHDGGGRPRHPYAARAPVRVPPTVPRVVPA
jgi:glutamate-ammonia-ligase adenylyltransferase